MSSRTPAPAVTASGLLQIRPYDVADEAGLLDVWNTGMWADPISEATWRSVYLTDPNFRREHCLVATAAGSVVGFVLAFAPADNAPPLESTIREGWVVGFGTLPEFRRRGIASALFDTLERAVLAIGIGRLMIGPYIPSYITPGVDIVAYPDAVTFLEHRGASSLSSPLSMKVSLTGYVARPAGGTHSGTALVVREASAADLVPCMEFIRSEFPHWVPDVATVASQIFGGDPLTVSLLIALDNDGVVGFAMSRGERFGPFGVREQARGRGIGGRLLSATLMTMRAKGFHCAWFLWTNDRAARLYEAHGFAEVRRFALMARELSE